MVTFYSSFIIRGKKTELPFKESKREKLVYSYPKDSRLSAPILDRNNIP